MKDKKRKILCVDDEPVNLQLLDAFLRPQGYEILMAESGAQAIELIRIHMVDIVLLDVMMPDMDGFEVCQYIKQDEKLRHIPVIIMTALTDKKERIRGIEAGAEEFLSKPLNFAEVLARVRMLIQMKALNDRLSFAYNDMVTLTAHGEGLMHRFDPVNFNFQASIDDIMKQTLKKGDARPENIIVGVFNDKDNTWQWTMHRYGAADAVFETEPLAGRYETLLTFPKRGSSATSVLNEQDMEGSELAAFLAEMHKSIAPIDNVVSYVSGALCIFAINYGYAVSSFDASVLNNFVVQSLFLKNLSAQVQETEDAFEYMVYSLARAAESSDEDTGNHILRVGSYSATIAEYLGMDTRFIQTIRCQATLHDVGKIHIPEVILKKPRQLTMSEWQEMKQHSAYGAKIIGSHYRLSMAASIALTHHEKWDGSGYPNGLKAEQIPIEGRIVSLADIYDALINPRVYKPAFSAEATYNILTKGDGRVMPHHFDPQVLDAFINTASRFTEIYEELKNK
ncbi:MAG: response regulator [Candidatus Magnetominusculus sp. LBB02]|nr:response regulator [Candidatus Magnetominusculus sp. LBB02]